MNKKILFSILGMILLIGIVTSISLGINKEIRVTKDTSVIIENINNKSIERGDIICNERTCTQYMWKGDYNLGSETIEKYKCEVYQNQTNETTGETTELCISEKLLKDDKIISELTKQQEKRLEELAKVIMKRKERTLKELKNKITIEDSGSIVLIN